MDTLYQISGVLYMHARARVKEKESWAGHVFMINNWHKIFEHIYNSRLGYRLLLAITFDENQNSPSDLIR